MGLRVEQGRIRGTLDRAKRWEGKERDIGVQMMVE